MIQKTIGSRAEVFHGTALKTSSGPNGLMKNDLFMDNDGQIKSKKASARMLKMTKEGKNPLAPFILSALEGSAKAKTGFKKVPKKGTKAYKKLVN